MLSPPEVLGVTGGEETSVWRWRCPDQLNSPQTEEGARMGWRVIFTQGDGGKRPCHFSNVSIFPRSNIANYKPAAFITVVPLQLKMCHQSYLDRPVLISFNPG